MHPSGKRYRDAALCATLLFSVVAAQAQTHSMPTRHIRKEVNSGEARFLNRLPTTQFLRLNIVLPLRNEPQLDGLLQKLYDPQSPLFHRFLSVQEFTERFGPTEEDYAAVVHFAEQNGLTVTGTSINRLVVDVTAPVANIERAFHVTMSSYQHPTEPRAFYSPDREPSADLKVPLWHIAGLENFSIPHPASLRRQSDADAAPTHDPSGNASGGSAPGGYFLGSDMRTAYYGGSLTGTGQSVGLVEFLGYNVADVTNYFAKAKQSFNVNQVIGVSTDRSSLSCTGRCDDTEQALDIEQAISMAPGMSHVYVYVSDTSDVSIFNRMATDNLAKSLSCSWGWSPADPTSDDPIFKEFAAHGQNLFAASGDSGSYGKGQSSRDVYPADDAYVTSVGGTDLTTNGANGPWKSETAWSYSGGGVSPDNIAIPLWQKTTGVITTANKGSTTLRNCPDVAAEANTDNYACYDGTCAGGWGGTSFAAPRWAGYLALVNQQAGSQIGFINPALYTLGLGSSSGSVFHDITSGSNGTYSAQKGYDLVTGWGSPNGAGIGILASAVK